MPINDSINRRQMLLNTGTGFGALALCDLLSVSGKTGELGHSAQASGSPLRKQADHRPSAKSVIFVFLEGGPSHLDTFDPKPALSKLAGQKLPSSFKPVITPMGEYDAPLLASKRKWSQHGKSGLWVSDWLPEIAQCVDDIAVIRSCVSDGLNHSNGVCQMNSGAIVGGRPSLGSWASYGLGTENEDLPSFVVIEDQPGKVINGPRNWSAGFMPAAYQGTPFLPGEEPIGNLAPPLSITSQRQRSKLNLIQQLNEEHAKTRSRQSDLQARIKSYELAFRMQSSAPEAVDLSLESNATQELYGMNEKSTEVFGRNCLLARRLVERGVRFVQLYHGSGSRWDAHSNIEKNHTENCRSSDKPVAGLLKDLKQRGLLDETLVIWGGEFGRTPMSEKGDGRDHNPYGFTMWMAGGGIRGGRTYGSTDELGLHAQENRLHVLDLHATVLHALGVNPMELTYLHGGRPERPTINTGRPCLALFN